MVGRAPNLRLDAEVPVIPSHRSGIPPNPSDYPFENGELNGLPASGSDLLIADEKIAVNRLLLTTAAGVLPCCLQSRRQLDTRPH